ncbi:MAG: alpha/beta hydrolase [Chloroflexi bacterium]|nr:alpha/beta hydrolase [Chloroflexota bacterium]MYF80814.1 alpha/beta hydrolase [Chloroflexota bacterium]MYI05393.1 alpha/beta hydrolase [Chloroflexota bacterium]
MATHHPERIVEGNGIEICTDAFGEPADPCILLVMGAGSSMLLWEVDFCQRLADGGRFVIRYDNRDTGRTTSCPPGEPDYTLADMAADGVAVLDAYGVEQAHIIGASMGGMITQLIGLNHPERVLTLTPIMSTPNPGATLEAADAFESGAHGQSLSPPEPKILEAIGSMADVDWTDRDSVVAVQMQMFRALAGSKYPDDGHLGEEFFAADFERSINYASSFNHGPAIAQSEPWDQRLQDLDVPTLVIHGNDDPILPYDHGQALHAAIPGATLLTMDGVGHELPRPIWDTVVPAILEHTA